MIIPIVFSVDRNFRVPLRVALASLVDNKKPDTYYDIYILHSDDFNKQEIGEVKYVLKNHPENKLHFISMGDAYHNTTISNSIWTKTIFYRLSVHKILPEIYDRCIYCDCDVVINCDLQILFQEKIDNFLLAGARDRVICYAGYRKMFPDSSKYINSGILLINLKKWRDIHIENLFEKYISCVFRYPDQDILNLVCRDNILFLEEDKYILSGILNRRKYSKIQDVIVHYCGLVKPWNIQLNNPYFNLWIHYAKNVMFDDKELLLKEKRERINAYLKEHKIYEVLIWGMLASTLDVCYFLEELGVKVVAIGDNDKDKVAQGNEYYKMISAGDISGYQQYHYMVMAVNYYKEIKEQLVRASVSENKILCWSEFRQLMN